MPGIEQDRAATGWCFGCNAETRHEDAEAACDRRGDGLVRRTRVCVECGVTKMTVVELSEVELNRLRRAEAELQEARRAFRRLLEAVLSGEELPAPFRRTEPCCGVTRKPR